MSGVEERGIVTRLISAIEPRRLLGVLVAASLLLPILLFGAFSYLSYLNHVRTAQTRLSQTLDVVHEHIRKVFETHDLASLHVLDLMDGRSLEELRASERSIHTRLSALKNAMPHVRDIRVIAADGTPVVSASVYPFLASPQVDYTQLKLFRAHRDAAADRHISELLQSRLRSGLFFVDSMAWRSEQGVFRGVILVSVDSTYFQSFFGGFDTDHVFSLVRDDGAVLVRYPNPPSVGMHLPVTTPLLAEITRNPQRGQYRAISSIDGVERLASYRKLESLPVYVTANFAMSEVRNTWIKDILSHLLLAAPATFGLFLISLLAYAQSIRQQRASQRLREEIDRRELTEARLVQAQKMEAVGRLTGGIAHDFNNLLTIILGNLEAIKRQVKEPTDRVKRSLENARQGAERAAALTHRLLAFSRRQPLEAKPLDLNDLIAGMADLMRRTIGENITIEFDCTAPIGCVVADPHQIENALLNLVINARDAMPDGGRLAIGTADITADEVVRTSSAPQVPPGLYVVLSVSDTGTGISQDVIDKVFEPFFTTKPVGQGTGLGLSMVYGFMQQSGGHVLIDSELERGTRVRLFFPRAEGVPVAKAEKSLGAEAETEASGKGEMILVCEDDEGVRSFSSQTLKDLGYAVIEAVDMSDALKKLERSPDVKLLFTDIVLPGAGNGRRLADEALRLRPGLKVLFTTGYTDEADIIGGHPDEHFELLTKPFSSTTLAHRIRRTLES